jgi:tetratricopeptide (TPR) repeat protein
LRYFAEAGNKRSHPALDYNLGAVYYRQGDMDKALNYFERAAEQANSESLRANALYNQGNCMFKLAFSEQAVNRQVAVECVRQSIQLYEQVVARAPDYADAVFNLKVAQAFMQLLQQAKQQADSQSDNDQDNDDDEQMDDDEDGDMYKQRSSEKPNSSRAPSQMQSSDEEQQAPNLTPDDVLEEERRNQLKRSRKKFSKFGETEKNW